MDECKPAEASPNTPPSGDVGSGVSTQDAAAPLATRGRRLAAACLDGLLYFLPMLALGVGGIVAGSGRDGRSPAALSSAEIFAVGLCGFGLLALVIVQGLLVATTGQSLGKRWLKIRIVRLDGGPVDLVTGVLLRSWLLAALSAIPGAGGLFYLVDALTIFREDRRCVHDLIAGTKVIVAK